MFGRILGHNCIYQKTGNSFANIYTVAHVFFILLYQAICHVSMQNSCPNYGKVNCFTVLDLNHYVYYHFKKKIRRLIQKLLVISPFLFNTHICTF